MGTLKLIKEYKRYPSYKNSGVEWIGDIPEGWEIQKLYVQFEFRDEKVSDKDYPPLSVTYGGVVPQMDNVAKAVADGNARKRVSIGDIAINGRSDRRGAAGFSNYDGSVSLIYHVLKSRANKRTSRYFHYLIRSTIFGNEFYRWGRGIVDDLWTTRSSEMKRILLPVPSDDDQERIATYLDEKTALIDEIIEKKKRHIKLLRNKRDAIINYTVTRGLNPNAKLVASGIKWLDQIPEGWKVKKIKHTIKSVTSGIWGDEANGDENDIKCLRVADFDYGHLGYGVVSTVRNNANLARQRVLQKDDLLIERSGGGEKTPVGRVIEFDGTERMTCANFIDIIRVNQKFVLSSFLAMYFYTLFNNGIVRKYIKQTTGIQNLDVKAYFTELVALPPIPEQKPIIEYVHTIIASQQEAESKIQDSINKLQQFKSALISNVVTGKVKI